MQKISNGATLYSETDGYDAAGNVASVNTTLPTGTDNQGYCYDEQNRLTWAGTSGCKPCGGTVTAGSYTYGDSGHKHAATQVGAASNYTAQYDTSGNMTCWATGGTTCGSTAAVLSYDNEGRLTTWQNKPSSPTATDSFLYDGEGNCVEQLSASGGITSLSVYVGSLMKLRIAV